MSLISLFYFLGGFVYLIVYGRISHLEGKTIVITKSHLPILIIMLLVWPIFFINLLYEHRFAGLWERINNFKIVISKGGPSWDNNGEPKDWFL